MNGRFALKIKSLNPLYHELLLILCIPLILPTVLGSSRSLCEYCSFAKGVKYIGGSGVSQLSINMCTGEQEENKKKVIIPLYLEAY